VSDGSLQTVSPQAGSPATVAFTRVLESLGLLIGSALEACLLQCMAHWPWLEECSMVCNVSERCTLQPGEGLLWRK
jgi:hypothetical protein